MSFFDAIKYCCESLLGVVRSVFPNSNIPCLAQFACVRLLAVIFPYILCFFGLEILSNYSQK